MKCKYLWDRKTKVIEAKLNKLFEYLEIVYKTADRLQFLYEKT